MQSKSCFDCHTTKAVADFHKSSRAKDGRQSRCKGCHSAWMSAYYKRNPSKNAFYKAKYKERYKLRSRTYSLKSRYNMTEAGYLALLSLQGGVYAICQITKQRTLHVDHCHVSSKVRGLLCAACNIGIGTFKDDSNILRNAIHYLERNQTEQITKRRAGTNEKA